MRRILLITAYFIFFLVVAILSIALLPVATLIYRVTEVDVLMPVLRALDVVSTRIAVLRKKNV